MSESVIDPIAIRRDEVSQYESNIALFTSIAASLPSEWPAHLLQFKGSTTKHEDVAKVENLADVELLGDLWAYEDAQAAIRAEIVEKRKAEAILTALLAAN